ncbi:MAG: magnesium transporter [Pseudomonadota bacterium]
MEETAVGVLNGLAFAVVAGALAWAWAGDGRLGAVIGVAMIVNLLVAGLAGAGVPLTLQKLKIDPAIASAVFVTTVTDVVGFFVFLGLAAVVLL